AARQVARGSTSLVIAGGTETPISDYTMAAYYAAGVLSRWVGEPAQACRPFDALRSGLVIGEGGAAVVVEDEQHARARGARIYARILGYDSVGEGGDLHHTDVSGHAAAKAIKQALHEAQLSISDVDYFCAHGNASIEYDVAETA